MGQLKIPTIASTDRSTSTWAAAEVLYDSNQSRIYYGNAAAAGGVLLATGNPGAVAVTAPGASMSAGTLQFSNSPTVTFGMVGSTITASAAAGGGGAVSFSAGTSSAALSSLVFSNSNAVNFGLNGSTITASAAFSNANGISFGLSGGTVITASHNALTTAALSDHSHGASGSNGSFAFQTLSFSNANGISFGTSAGSAIVASHNGLTTAAQSDHSHGNPTLALTNLTGTTASNSAGFTLSLAAGAIPTAVTMFATGNTTQSSTGTQALSSLIFRGSGVASVGISNGSVLIDVPAATSPDASVGMAAGGVTSDLDMVVFSNSNGISFGLNGSTITGSHNGLTTAALSNHQHTLTGYATGNTVLSSSGGLSLTSLIFRGSNIVSVGVSNGSVIFDASIPLYPAASINVSAGTTSTDLAAVTFSNANGISFGLNGSVVTASHNALTTAALSDHSHGNPTLALTNLTGTTASNSAGFTLSLSAAAAGGGSVNFSGGTTSNNLAAVTFGNANGISFGLNAGTMTASVATSLTAIRVSAGTASNNLSAITFGSSPTFSFGLNGSVITGNPQVVVNLNGVQKTVGAVNINDGAVTWAWDADTLIADSPPSISVVNISAGTATRDLSAVTFSNANGISFGFNTGSVLTASHNALTTAALSNHSHGNPTLALTNLTGTTASNSAGFTLSLSAAAPGAGSVNFSAGTTSANLAAITFGNANGISFGLNAGTITGSHNALTTAAASDHSHGNPTLALTNLTGTTASNSAGFTLSLSAAQSGGATLSNAAPWGDRPHVAGQVGQGTLAMQPWPLGHALQFDRVAYPIFNSNATNSSGSHTLSFWGGIYTKNASTLSLLQSWSNSTALTHSGTVGSYSLFSGGPRHWTVGFTTTLTAGDYWLGFISRTTSGGADGTYSNFVCSAMASNQLGHFGSSHNTTYQSRLGQGIYTATTSAMPSSVAFSQLRGSDSLAQRVVPFIFASGTV